DCLLRLILLADRGVAGWSGRAQSLPVSLGNFRVLRFERDYKPERHQNRGGRGENPFHRQVAPRVGRELSRRLMPAFELRQQQTLDLRRSRLRLHLNPKRSEKILEDLLAFEFCGAVSARACVQKGPFAEDRIVLTSSCKLGESSFDFVAVHAKHLA